MSKTLHITRSRLTGRVRVGGAKNSALKLLTASLLTDAPVTIRNFPAGLTDIQVHLGMLAALDRRAIVEGDAVRIEALSGPRPDLAWDGPSIRNTLLIFGALLARNGRASVPLPGGCTIGERKYDLHQLVLEQLGARVWEEDGRIRGEAPAGLRGAEVFLPLRSTGATENAVIAGSLARGTTVLWNPHIRPEILDLIAFLRSMGARIEVRGQESIVVQGVEALGGVDHRTMPDNMEAITYLIAAAATGGDVEILDFPSQHLEVPLIHLRESGAKFYAHPDGLIVRGGCCYPVEIATGPYPGINSDMQPLFAVFGLMARGESRIADLRFPDRFGYAAELSKMGGDLRFEKGMLHIRGGRPLKGAEVTALDLRCGAALVLAGLVADGETVIRNAGQIDRGYEDLQDKLSALGARVTAEGC